MATKKKAKKKKTSPKTKPKPAAKKVAPPVKKLPRQTTLAGMEDKVIEAIDDAALSYVEVRDQRIALQSGDDGEKAQKQRLMDLMHAHKKKSYKHGNISIEIVPEAEKIKVKVGAQTSDEPGDPGQEVEEEEPKQEETEPTEVIDSEFEEVEESEGETVA